MLFSKNIALKGRTEFDIQKWLTYSLPDFVIILHVLSLIKFNKLPETNLKIK